MSWLDDELNPVKNWRGWLVVLVLVFLFGLVGALDNPADQEACRDAARQIQKEHRQ